MSGFYKGKRTYRLFDPLSKEPFALSRSKIDLFLSCPRCFYLDRRLGVGQPPGYPFSLNSAVDKLLKKEFDIHRVRGTKHPLMENYGISAVPVVHEKLEIWRENFKGIQYHHKATNFIISGAIDDLWINPEGEYIIVDYKSTSKEEEVNLDAEWQNGYKRQMEIYQWLFRQSGFKVNKTGYFVYCNGKTDREAFDAKLEFDIKIIPYEGDDGWIEDTLTAALKCLKSDDIPEENPGCDFCLYIKSVNQEIRPNEQTAKPTVFPKKFTRRSKIAIPANIIPLFEMPSASADEK